MTNRDERRLHLRQINEFTRRYGKHSPVVSNRSRLFAFGKRQIATNLYRADSSSIAEGIYSGECLRDAHVMTFHIRRQSNCPRREARACDL